MVLRDFDSYGPGSNPGRATNLYKVIRDMMKILTGTSYPELAELIAQSAGVELCATDITQFPDGEIVNIVDNVRGDDLFIVQSVSIDPNNALMELLIMIDAAKRICRSYHGGAYYMVMQGKIKDQPEHYS